MVKQLFLAKAKEDMAQRIRFLITKCAEFRALTGYFYFSGVRALYEAMKANQELKIRILVGMHAELEAGQVVEVAQKPNPGETDEEKFALFCESLRKVLGSRHMDNQAFHERVDFFAKLMLAGRLEMRQTREPNHAKLYLFTLREGEAIDNVLITGSSNLTEPGLGGQGEVNAQLMDYGWVEADAYFEELWKDAVPLTATEDQRKLLMQILRDQSVAAELTPYEAWLRVLWEYVESRKLTLQQAYLEKLLAEAGMAYFTYQRDAVAQGLAFLRDYGGVVVADVVGLGKSIVACLIGKLSRRRGLILCPPGIKGDDAAGSGWKGYCAKFQLNDWKVMSSGNLDAALEMLKNDPFFEMVVVDEAHRFRNMTTDEYAKLLQICRGRQVVALTATPFNNKPEDLLALLHLFSPLKQSNLVPGGDLEAAFGELDDRFARIRDIRKVMAIGTIDWDPLWVKLRKIGIEMLSLKNPHDSEEVKAAVTAQFKKLSLTMRRIIENVTIRRNRLDLKHDKQYSQELKDLIMPEDPIRQFYELTPEQNAFYDRVTQQYFAEDGKFKGTIYVPGLYQGKADSSQLNLFSLVRRRFVRRLESSFGAFKKSVENQIKVMECVRDFAQKSGIVFYSQDANQDLEELLGLPEDEFQEQLALMISKVEAEARKKARVVQTLYRVDDSQFKKTAYFADIESDIKLLRQVLQEFDACMSVEDDPKAKALAEMLKLIVAGKHADLPSAKGDPRRKVLVFTEFADTLEHLDKALAGTGLRCLTAWGVTDSVLANFDASLPVAEQRDDYDVILTTDKLSEGLNLNRAGAVVNYDIPWNPTRVIQRVGRINRMGKRVFQKLYLLNFFPTLKGQSYVQNVQIAETKLWAMNQALGEDSRYFEMDETPTAAKLFDKVGKMPGDSESELSAYTKMKLVLEQEKEAHPETLERVKGLPPFVKTAIVGGGNVYLFERMGQAFHVFKTQLAAKAPVEEVDIVTAMGAIRRPFETPAAPLPEGFWGKDGSYRRLTEYKVTRDNANRAMTQSNAFKAKSALMAALQKQPVHPHHAFIKELLKDITCYGTLADATLRQLWKSVDFGDAEFDLLIEKLWEDHGRDDHYLAKLPPKREPDILVTVAGA